MRVIKSTIGDAFRVEIINGYKSVSFVVGDEAGADIMVAQLIYALEADYGWIDKDGNGQELEWNTGESNSDKSERKSQPLSRPSNGLRGALQTLRRWLTRS